LNLLQQSKSANHELTLLVWLLGRNLQVLYSLKQSLRPAQEVFASFKIWPQQIPQFQQGLKFFTQHQLGKLIEAIHEIDVNLKSGKLPYCWLKLEKFLLES
jgi:DNA polymerase III delta subunit